MDFKKLIVAIDFSEVSLRAARAAVALAARSGAEVVLVHAVAPGADSADGGDLIDEVRPGIERQLKELCAKLSAGTNAKLDWGVVDGNPATELATFAERWGGDMIVAGTLGRSGISRALLGSVAETLIRHAKVPVMVVGPNVPG